MHNDNNDIDIRRRRKKQHAHTQMHMDPYEYIGRTWTQLTMPKEAISQKLFLI